VIFTSRLAISYSFAKPKQIFPGSPALWHWKRIAPEIEMFGEKSPSAEVPKTCEFFYERVKNRR
jgi:hypothetical protein